MSNATINVPRLLGSYGYVIEGSVFCICNLLIGFSVLKHRALRHSNQHVLLMALAFGDAANLFAFITAGVYRVWLMNTNQLNAFRTPMQCLLTPHAMFWMTAYPFSALMLVILSCDRLFMVSFPATYILSLPSPKYSYIVVSTGIALVCAMALPGVLHVLTLPAQESQTSICHVINLMKTNPEPLGNIFLYYYQHIGYLALASVAIFIAVPLVHKLRATDLGAPQQQTQNRMTKTVALSCVCTLLLFCIPDRLAHVALNQGSLLLAYVSWMLSLTNPAANIIIYELRHHEMRLALRALVKWKTMPDILSLWPKQGSTPKPNNQVGVGGQAMQMVPPAQIQNKYQPVEPLQIENF